MNTQTPFMLTGEHNWPIWLNQVKLMATTQHIWEYIDPKCDNQPELPAVPTRPYYTRYKENANSFLDLDELSQRAFTHDYEMWKELAYEAKEIREKYSLIDTHIFNTVASQYQPILIEKNGPCEKLKALSERFTKNPYANI